MNIAVLVSGGVDSSVALHMLHNQGHTVTAFYLKIWLEDELSSLATCPWEEDLYYVRAVCAQLQVPLEIVSLQQEYHDRVVSYMLTQIKQGCTPNPDMLCNQQVKFGAFYDIIQSSYDRVATGHYAQVRLHESVWQLSQSSDTVKDQTYFLALLSQEQLSRALFPIGHLTKPEVRQYAAEHELMTQRRKDSQGICFLGKFSFTEFLEYHVGVQEGPLVEYESGAIMGKHRGFWFYTIGQRKGIGLPGGPWYVVRKDSVHNIVYISRTYEKIDAIRGSLYIPYCHWISGHAPDTLTSLQVKLRHGPKQYPATLVHHPGGGYHVSLAEKDQGIASGQFAVLYRDNECLGGGAMEQWNTERNTML